MYIHKWGKHRLSTGFIAFLQAFGLLLYCGLVGLILWNGNRWFGTMPHFLGPVLALILFSTSALVCALIVGSYPFLLFWDKKQTKEALRLVTFTALWSIFFTLLLLLLIAVF